jgi:hypothetical protein
MFTDADDLVNRKVSQYVAAHRGANGWYTPSEFYYAYGSRWIRKNSRPPMVSGPCVIVRSDLLKFATNPFKGFWLNLIVKGGERAFAEQLASRNRRINTLAAVGLAHFQKLMTIEGAPLEPLPFTSNVVINHLDSTSQVAGGLGTSVPLNRTARLNLRSCLNRLKRVGLCLPSVLPLTQALREEFTIPALNAVPNAYKRKGSIFSRDIYSESWLRGN